MGAVPVLTPYLLAFNQRLAIGQLHVGQCNGTMANSANGPSRFVELGHLLSNGIIVIQIKNGTMTAREENSLSIGGTVERLYITHTHTSMTSCTHFVSGNIQILHTWGISQRIPCNRVVHELLAQFIIFEVFNAAFINGNFATLRRCKFDFKSLVGKDIVGMGNFRKVGTSLLSLG